MDYPKPIKDLIEGIDNTSNELKTIANNLPYRDFITIGVLVNKLNLKNETKIKTISNIIPDCWIYVQDSDVKLGRIQIFNNWSPYLVKDFKNTCWIGLEYFCKENDNFWNLGEKERIDFVSKELIKMKDKEHNDEMCSNLEKKQQWLGRVNYIVVKTKIKNYKEIFNLLDKEKNGFISYDMLNFDNIDERIKWKERTN